MRMKIAAIAAGIVFLSLGGAAQAQSKVGLHLEACTEWREFDGNLYTRNVCARAVTIMFMTLDGNNRTTRTLERNEPFDTGIRIQTSKDLGWIATTCPAGFRSDVELTPDNRQRFLDSDYDCVPR